MTRGFEETVLRSVSRQAVALSIIVALIVALVEVLVARVAIAQQNEPRIAFVVGNGGTVLAPLRTAINDSGLVAEALRTIGFDVVEGAELNQTDFLRSLRRFVAKVETSGPGAIAFVYFSGNGFQYDGESHLVMADARLEREADIPLDSVRLSDVLRALAGTPARANIVVIDAARRSPFAIASANVTNGLAAVEAPRRTLVAFSAAPASVADDVPGAYGPGPYGAFARAVAEMIRTPGLDAAEMFARIRARTHQTTQGRQTPWEVSALDAVTLVPANRGDATAPVIGQGSRPRSPEDAYAFAIWRDTLSGYVDFITAYPRHVLAPRVRAMLRVRREALVWLRAIKVNTPSAMWTYLQRYPAGGHVASAKRRLERLAASATPPSDFAPMEMRDVPPSLPDEERTVADIGTSASVPVMLNDPPPAYLKDLPAPPPRIGGHVLPTPKLPPMAMLVSGSRAPFASVTGLPGVVGPVPASESLSGQTGRSEPAVTIVDSAAITPSTSTPSKSTQPTSTEPTSARSRAELREEGSSKRRCGRRRRAEGRAYC